MMAGCALAVAVGLFARMPGSSDTTGPNRLLAKNLAGEGLEALMAGDYSEARAKLDLALKEDNLFAEAWLGRAMTLLAIGDLRAAGGDARRAHMLFSDGHFEPRAWEDQSEEDAKAEGMLIAKRIECLAATAEAQGSVSTQQSSEVFRLFYDLRRAATCEAAQTTLRTWRRHPEAHRIVSTAIELCNDLWPCMPEAPR